VIREDTTRLNSPKMEYYREVYRNSPRWNGAESLENKRLLVYCEQGLGDQIQFLRYIPIVVQKYTNCNITLHLSNELCELVKKDMIVPVDVLDRDNPALPDHDFHITSMSLPFALQEFEDVPCNYLKADKVTDIYQDSDHFKIGIAWEGNPDHSNNDERNCPLKYFNILKEAMKGGQRPLKLFSLQKKYYDPLLLDDTNSLELFSIKLENMMDTANLIHSMDAVVCVDTVILHLAGTLRMPTWGMLSHRHDHRWVVKNWYDTVTLVKQKTSGDWKWVMEEIASTLKEITQPG
jgi:hypothetical protein